MTIEPKGSRKDFKSVIVQWEGMFSISSDSDMGSSARPGFRQVLAWDIFGRQLTECIHCNPLFNFSRAVYFLFRRNLTGNRSLDDSTPIHLWV